MIMILINDVNTFLIPIHLDQLAHSAQIFPLHLRNKQASYTAINNNYYLLLDLRDAILT